jgi:membrane fusion protein, multidrug efflux system
MKFSVSKKWVWTLLALLIVLVALGLVQRLRANKADASGSTATAGAATNSKTGSNGLGLSIELAASDVLGVKTQDLAQGLAVSGALRAVNSAVLKARVAGELQGLMVREGDFVKADQVLAKIDPTDYQSRLRQAQQQADSAKAQMDIAQRQHDNNKALVDQGFISKTALDTTANTLVGAQATHKAAMAAVEVTQKALDDTLLRSPIGGQIAQRLAQNGERVGIDARVLEVVDISRLEMEATLSPADSAQVRVGQRALLQIEGSAQALAASVVRINPSLVAGSRAVLVYLALDSSAGLRQGLFAQGTLGTSKLRTLAVPAETIRNDKPEPYVQLLVDGVVKHQRVEPGVRGQAGGLEMVAIKGVSEGAQVLAGSVGTLADGSLVQRRSK